MVGCLFYSEIINGSSWLPSNTIFPCPLSPTWLQSQLIPSNEFIINKVLYPSDSILNFMHFVLRRAKDRSDNAFQCIQTSTHHLGDPNKNIHNIHVGQLGKFCAGMVHDR